MPIQVATHSGSFHADEVLAFALIRAFLDPDASVVRTRDAARIERADVAIDVGGVHDPQRRRFDHHQRSYAGERSSAGMVLDWLAGEGRIAPEVADALDAELVRHVDAVDTGRLSPTRGVPCFSSIVATLNHPARSPEEQLEAYLAAVSMAERLVEGVRAGCERIAEARAAVEAAMERAEARGARILELDRYLAWKTPYFAAGGADHPTDYVLFPAETDWRVVAIPPELGSFDKKRPFPEEWAGLEGAALDAAVGVEGAVFCHKNRFLAVFRTRDAALEAMERWDLGRP